MGLSEDLNIRGMVLGQWRKVLDEGEGSQTGGGGWGRGAEERPTTCLFF